MARLTKTQLSAALARLAAIRLGPAVAKLQNSAPLLFVAAPLSAGIALYDAPYPAIWLALLVAAASVFYFFSKHSWIFTTPLFGLAGYALALVATNPVDIKYDDKVDIVAICNSNGKVYKKWRTFDAQIISYKDSAHNWRNTKCNVILSIDTSVAGIGIGTVLKATNRLRKIDGAYGRNQLQQGVAGRFYGYNIEILGRDSSFFTSSAQAVERYRAKIAAKITDIDSTDIGATSIISALTIGERGAMPMEVTQSYRRTGTSHLLSISGLHVGIIFSILNLIFGSIRIIPRGRLIFGVIVIALLWLYTVFSGMSPATIRATIMFTVFQIAIMRSVAANSLNVLCLSAIILLLINPLYVFNVGFQLSYIAMLGIVTLYSPIASLIKVKSSVLRAFWSVSVVSFAAQIAVAPIVAYHFGQIPLMGLALNIVIWITVPVIIVGAMLFLATNIAFIGSWTAIVAGWQNDIIGYTAGKSWVTVDGITISLIATYAIYAVLIALAVTFKNARSK